MTDHWDEDGRAVNIEQQFLDAAREDDGPGIAFPLDDLSHRRFVDRVMEKAEKTDSRVAASSSRQYLGRFLGVAAIAAIIVVPIVLLSSLQTDPLASVKNSDDLIRALDEDVMLGVAGAQVFALRGARLALETSRKDDTSVIVREGQVMVLANIDDPARRIVIRSPSGSIVISDALVSVQVGEFDTMVQVASGTVYLRPDDAFAVSLEAHQQSGLANPSPSEMGSDLVADLVARADELGIGMPSHATPSQSDQNSPESETPTEPVDRLQSEMAEIKNAVSRELLNADIE